MRSLPALGVAALIVLVGLQVVAREVALPFVVYDEILNLVFVWVVFWGAGVLAIGGDHIRVDLVESLLARRAPRWLRGYRVLVRLLGGVFGAAFCYSSVRLMAAARGGYSPMLAWSQNIWYAAMLAGAAMILGAELAGAVRLSGRRGWQSGGGPRGVDGPGRSERVGG